MSQISKHIAMKRLVELGVVIPGIFNGTPGNITYSPISIEEFKQRIENGDTENLAYNTRTMGRGIFTFDEAGQILNYKGADSKLRNSDSIAVQSTEGELETLNGQDSYGINIAHFVDRSSKDASARSRLEFRIKGASQFQNLLVEKIKNDDIRKRDKRGLIRLPQIDLPTPLTEEMCDRFDLPRVVDVDDDFLSTVDPKSYAGYCLAQMEHNGIPFERRNELWREYFERHHRERLSDEQLMQVVAREDQVYGLGATFGQTTRTLENPFRIMELQYYLKHNDIEAIRAILDYSSQGHEDILYNYADVASKNAAGFMNLKLAFNNFEHRQDYPLSGEICDDSFDDVSDCLYRLNPSREDEHRKLQHYSQVYIFITNMKIIEDAYRLIGREVPSDYRRHFVETFYDSLEDKANFRLCFQNPNPMADIGHFTNAEANFDGMEAYMQEIRQIAVEVYKERNVERNDSDVHSKEKHGQINVDIE